MTRPSLSITSTRDGARPLAANEFRFATLWRLDAPIEEVWDAITHPLAWPEWWPGVEHVVELDKGDDSGLGARQRYIWRSLLGYRLTFETCVVCIEPLALLEGAASGELEGLGRWTFRSDGRSTAVHYDWHVHTTTWLLNLLTPIARPVFRWNHDALMHAGAHGLAHKLGARLLEAGALSASRNVKVERE